MKNMRHILNTLPAFVESARLGSFTKAGDKLGMAQPSVSRFIHNLEASTGLNLFHRNHNQIELTENGKLLFDAVTLGFDHISGTIATLHESAGNSVVTIGCSHGFSHMWLQARLPEIQKSLPQHKVQIVTTDHTVSLTHDEVSCAVRLGNGNWPDCVSKFLFAEEVFPVCSLEFAQNNNIMDKKSLTANDLKALPLLVLDTGKFAWLGWREWFSYYGINYELAPSSELINNYAFTLQAAMAGQGVALMWSKLDAPYLDKNWLIELGCFRVKSDNAYYLTFPKNSPYIESFSQVFV
jgi:DNA-binding transcriptional LysR family regulator